jgi:hypothetical protein
MLVYNKQLLQQESFLEYFPTHYLPSYNIKEFLFHQRMHYKFV